MRSTDAERVSPVAGTALRALRLNRYQVHLRALEPLDLPAYLGSTLRGAFGSVFRRVSCLAPRGGTCPTPEQCPYHLVFETAPPPDAVALRNLDDIPRPFVIAPPPAGCRRHEAGSEVAFDLTLIGRARNFLPHFVVTLREIRGLGRGRHPITLRRIEARAPAGEHPVLVYSDEDNLVRGHDASVSLGACVSVPPPTGRVTLRFLTYTRLKHEGACAQRPEFHVVFRRLLGRLSSLAVFHCGVRLRDELTWSLPARAHVAMLDDFGPEADLDTLSSYSPARSKRGKHRRWAQTIVPLGVISSGPGFTEYTNGSAERQ